MNFMTWSLTNGPAFVGWVIIVSAMAAVVVMSVALSITGIVDCIAFSANRIKKAVVKMRKKEGGCECKSPTK